MNEESDFHNNTPGIRSWIFVFGAGIACLLIFVLVSPKHDFSLFSFADEDVVDELSSEDEIEARKRTRKKRKGKRKSRRGKKGKLKKARNHPLDDTNEGYVFNDLEFGEVGRESDQGEEPMRARELAPLPTPPKSLWNPTANYRPNAVYSEAGRTRKIVSSIDFAAKGTGRKNISPSSIRSKLNTSVVMGCYNQAVNRAPKMRGRVKVKGTIEKDGHISYVKITSSQLKSRTVEKCIVKKIRRVRFSRAGQATKFSTSFSFSSR